MASGQIRMSPAELQAKSKRYGTSADRIQDVLGDLRNLQSDLRGEWEGRAFERFDEQFTDLEPKVERFAQLMLEIQDQLAKTAEAMSDQDEALSRNFGLG